MTLEEFSKMLYYDYKSIERINEIVNKHCIDWHTIAETLEEAIPLIQEKLELEKNKYINEFVYEKEKIQILLKQLENKE